MTSLDSAITSDSPATPIPTEAGFDGYGVEWYYWDRTKNTLTPRTPWHAKFFRRATRQNSVCGRVTINAPDVAIGSDEDTQHLA